MRRLAILGVIFLAACSDALEQDTTAGQVVAVTEQAPAPVVRLISAEDFSIRSVIPLSAAPSGQVASLESVLLLSSGSDVVVFDFAQANVSPARVIPVSATPGIEYALVFQDASVAWATFDRPSLPSPNRYIVARVNVVTGDTATQSLPALPRSLAIVHDAVFVLLAAPNEVCWLSVMDPATLQITDSVPLTPAAALAVTLGGDGLLYVIARGPSAGMGRLAIVDPVARAEVAVINGLGDPTGPVVPHPSGRLLVPSLQGILEVDPVRRSVTRGTGAGVMPSGDYVSGLVLDQRGREYGIREHCANVTAPAGYVYVLSPPTAYSLLETLEVGRCPVGAAAVFTQ